MHDIFIGKIENIYAQDDVLTDGKVDLSKMKPILFDMHQRKYWTIGRDMENWEREKRIAQVETMRETTNNHRNSNFYRNLSLKASYFNGKMKDIG